MDCKHDTDISTCHAFSHHQRMWLWHWTKLECFLKLEFSLNKTDITAKIVKKDKRYKDKHVSLFLSLCHEWFWTRTPYELQLAYFPFTSLYNKTVDQEPCAGGRERYVFLIWRRIYVRSCKRMLWPDNQLLKQCHYYRLFLHPW